MKFIAGFITAILILLLGGLAVMYTGAFNVAASSPHTAAGRWVLDTTMRRSVQMRAESVSAPQELTDQQVSAGIHAYNEMCATCHGAPGQDRSEIGAGLRPQPPNLAEAAMHWKPNELFWIVKHGIKMTGMPAFGATHEDAELWNIVAFVQQLPGVTAEQYRSLKETAAKAGHSH